MTKSSIIYWKSVCPNCEKDDAVYIFDRGMKFLYRSFSGNNRFACKNCMITWRRKDPFFYLDLSRNSLFMDENQDRPYS